ncbi:MAG: Gfo/Idh/MocA family oxidoreductase [Planctomycetes bacterium]|nr:Gfo/Idh/MocA family oxidoreductase [Planctomycetota bacterium]
MKHTRAAAFSRRTFLGRAGAGVAALAVVPRHVLGAGGAAAPSDRLSLACIGAGGRADANIGGLKRERILALCDVDLRRARGAFQEFPDAKQYRDFRVMLDELDKKIDAVVVSTPDHTHAVAAMAAIKRGKHVYCEKPLAHCIWECRQLTLAAREAKVATQLGNQGQASEGNRLVAELIWDGAIGPVREVHAWCNRPISQRGIQRPKEAEPVPATLNWDLWLGPARYRPYHSAYLPFRWRGWWDFGTGVLGDIGCHQLDPVFRALKLGYPTTVEACSSNMDEGPAVKEETAPKASIVRYEFPAREGFPALTLVWYDGGLMPQRPAELPEGRKFGEADDNLFVGDQGKILGYRLIPDARMKEYGKPPQKIARSPGHHKEWLIACKGGAPARANFDWAGPLTEAVLVGNIALKMEKELYQKGLQLHYDGPNMQVTNLPEANQYLRDEYREGWTL